MGLFTTHPSSGPAAFWARSGVAMVNPTKPLVTSKKSAPNRWVMLLASLLNARGFEIRFEKLPFLSTDLGPLAGRSFSGGLFVLLGDATKDRGVEQNARDLRRLSSDKTH